jgi:hypothetical protein
MVAAFVKRNVLSSRVITENFKAAVSATKHISKQANISKYFL